METSYRQLLAQKNSINLEIINKKLVSERSGACNHRKVATDAAIVSLRMRLNQLEKDLLKKMQV